MSASRAFELREAFAAHIGEEPRVFFAPGRVNLIGEHIDYCGGSVLPFAIDRGTWVALCPRDDDRVRVLSLDIVTERRKLEFGARGEAVESGSDASRQGPARIDAKLDQVDPSLDAKLDHVDPSLDARLDQVDMSLDARLDQVDVSLEAERLGWGAYPLAVVAIARGDGLPLTGFDLVVAGNLPREGGLSSSASLGVATAFALSEIFAWRLGLEALADLAWRAETQVVGVPCGIMDQYAVALGKRDHALLLDCRARTWRHVPMPGQSEVLVLNTWKPRALVESAYEERVRECETAARLLVEQRDVAGDASPAKRAASLDLATVSVAEVDAARQALGTRLWRRARHVASESERVASCLEAMHAGDDEAVGAALRAGHASLAANFEVSCPELDMLVEEAMRVPGVRGARLTGAGFGGCVVVLQEPGALSDERFAAIAARYEERFGYAPSRYAVRADDGPRECL